MFKMDARVRQGGVLSPVLFAVYVDDIIVNLKSSGYGCCFAGEYIGVLMYADDLLLISVTVTDLRKMLQICEDELQSIDMLFNVKKSAWLRFGTGYNNFVCPVMLNGQPLPLVSEVKYLGVVICAGRRFKISLNLVRMKFYRAFNALWSKLGGKASDTVILHLTKSFCVPILLYGLEAVPISKSVCNSLKCCWSRVLFRIFHVCSAENCYLISAYTGILSIDETLELRRLRFVQSLSGGSSIVHSLFYIVFKHDIVCA